VIWALAVGFAVWRAHIEINEFFDTQQVRLAQQVSALLPSVQLDGPPRRAPALPADSGAAELKDLSIAIWNERGELLLADREGAALPFDAAAEGFVNRQLGEASWRVVPPARHRPLAGGRRAGDGGARRGAARSAGQPAAALAADAAGAAGGHRRVGPPRAAAGARDRPRVQERRADSLAPLASTDAPANCSRC